MLQACRVFRVILRDGWAFTFCPLGCRVFSSEGPARKPLALGVVAGVSLAAVGAGGGFV